MEFKEYGNYDPNCLEFEDELQPLEFANLDVLMGII